MFIKPAIYYYNYVFSPHSDVKERASLAFCALSFFTAPPPPPPDASGSGTGEVFTTSVQTPSRCSKTPQPLPKSLHFSVGPSVPQGLSSEITLGHPHWEPWIWLCPCSFPHRQGLELMIKLQAVNSGEIILASKQQPTRTFPYASEGLW